METLLVYLIISVIITGVVVGGLYLKKKFAIKDTDLELTKLILQIIDIVVAKENIKYKGEISVVVHYCIEALIYMTEFENLDTISQKKDYISEKALKICEENGIKPDPDLIDLIDKVTDYLIK